MKIIELALAISIGLITLATANALVGIIDFQVFSFFLDKGIELNIEEWKVHSYYVIYGGLRELLVVGSAGFLSVIFFKRDLRLKGLVTALACGFWGFFILDLDSTLFSIITAMYFVSCALIGSYIAWTWKNGKPLR